MLRSSLWTSNLQSCVNSWNMPLVDGEVNKLLHGQQCIESSYWKYIYDYDLWLSMYIYKFF